MREALVRAALLAAVAILVGACQSSARVTPVIQTGRADAAAGAISITTDTGTYSVPLEGVAWTSVDGNRHESGRPECLAPGVSRQLRFASVEVAVQGVTWRPVVWVSCQ
jgi:hypothetical protein